MQPTSIIKGQCLLGNCRCNITRRMDFEVEAVAAALENGERDPNNWQVVTAAGAPGHNRFTVMHQGTVQEYDLNRRQITELKKRFPTLQLPRLPRRY